MKKIILTAVVAIIALTAQAQNKKDTITCTGLAPTYTRYVAGTTAENLSRFDSIETIYYKNDVFIGTKQSPNQNILIKLQEIGCRTMISITDITTGKYSSSCTDNKNNAITIAAKNGEVFVIRSL